MSIQTLDGTQHINIYSKGNTELGRWLSNFTLEPIEIPEHGNFKCLEGYWYWLTSRDSRLRELVGFNAKQLGKKIGKIIEMPFDEFKAHFSAAMLLKAKANPKMWEKLSQNKLPLKHYYIFNDQVVNAGHSWLIEEWNRIGKMYPNQFAE